MKNDLGYLFIDYNLLDIQLVEGYPKMVYQNKPFTGVAFERYTDGGYIEIVFLGGVENGLKREWYPNGNPKKEEFMFMNSYHGRYLEWYEGGAIKLDRTYEFGIKTHETAWDQSGLVVSEYKLTKYIPSYKSLETLRIKYRIRNREK